MTNLQLKDFTADLEQQIVKMDKDIEALTLVRESKLANLSFLNMMERAHETAQMLMDKEYKKQGITDPCAEPEEEDDLNNAPYRSPHTKKFAKRKSPTPTGLKFPYIEQSKNKNKYRANIRREGYTTRSATWFRTQEEAALDANKIMIDNDWVPMKGFNVVD